MNENVLKSLPPAQYAENIPAYLLDELGAKLFSFLYNPEEKTFSRSITYQDAPVALTSVQPQQYKSTSGRTLKLDNLLMTSWAERKSLRPLLEKLQQLGTADVKNAKYLPQVVYFAWGSESFGPAVLYDQIRWVETLWVGGEPAEVRLSITLQEIPPKVIEQNATDAKIDPDKKEREDTLKAALDRFTGGLSSAASDTPVISLTDRQRADGAKAAESYINEKTNIALLSAIDANRYRRKIYTLKVSQDGNVYFANSKNDAVKTIGTYNGRKFTFKY
jgi:hypothetical protein